MPTAHCPPPTQLVGQRLFFSFRDFRPVTREHLVRHSPEQDRINAVHEFDLLLTGAFTSLG